QREKHQTSDPPPPPVQRSQTRLYRSEVIADQQHAGLAIQFEGISIDEQVMSLPLDVEQLVIGTVKMRLQRGEPIRMRRGNPVANPQYVEMMEDLSVRRVRFEPLNGRPFQPLQPAEGIAGFLMQPVAEKLPGQVAQQDAVQQPGHADHQQCHYPQSDQQVETQTSTVKGKERHSPARAASG